MVPHIFARLRTRRHRMAPPAGHRRRASQRGCRWAHARPSRPEAPAPGTATLRLGEGNTGERTLICSRHASASGTARSRRFIR
jgi:hypothetical protein